MDDFETVGLAKELIGGISDAVLATSTAGMSIQEAIDVVFTHYRLDVIAKPLKGERDQNFQLLLGGVPQYLLKLANAAEPEGVVNFKIAALTHIASVDPDLPVQQVIRTEHGRMHFTWRAADGRKRIGYLLTFLPGTPMSSNGQSIGQRRSLGILAAKLSKALQGFTHPAANHELLWDLKHSLQLRRYLDQTTITLHRDLASSALDRFEMMVLPNHSKLRSQVIHNDLNPHNVLINGDGVDTASGIIDFGDMVHGALVNDVAVTCAYLFGQDCYPLAPICEFLASYGSILPLKENELRILPELIAARLAMTIVITN